MPNGADAERQGRAESRCVVLVADQEAARAEAQPADALPVVPDHQRDTVVTGGLCDTDGTTHQRDAVEFFELLGAAVARCTAGGQNQCVDTLVHFRVHDVVILALLTENTPQENLREQMLVCI